MGASKRTFPFQAVRMIKVVSNPSKSKGARQVDGTGEMYLRYRPCVRSKTKEGESEEEEIRFFSCSRVVPGQTK